jgi:apolipoprotein N-acyltransferase
MVAREWRTRNPSVLAVSRRPRWRRYPSWVYRWAAGGCAVAGAGIWWVVVRDGTSSLAAAWAVLLLIGAAVVLGFKALPLGFIRWDNAD